jgi:hypothetical protein
LTIETQQCATQCNNRDRQLGQKHKYTVLRLVRSIKTDNLHNELTFFMMYLNGIYMQAINEQNSLLLQRHCSHSAEFGTIHQSKCVKSVETPFFKTDT